MIDSTWAGTGIAKCDSPIAQTVAAVRYVSGRYSTPSKALAFYDRRNYY